MMSGMVMNISVDIGRKPKDACMARRECAYYPNVVKVIPESSWYKKYTNIFPKIQLGLDGTSIEYKTITHKGIKQKGLPENLTNCRELTVYYRCYDKLNEMPIAMEILICRECNAKHVKTSEASLVGLGDHYGDQRELDAMATMDHDGMDAHYGHSDHSVEGDSETAEPASHYATEQPEGVHNDNNGASFIQLHAPSLRSDAQFKRRYYVSRGFGTNEWEERSMRPKLLRTYDLIISNLVTFRNVVAVDLDVKSGNYSHFAIEGGPDFMLKTPTVFVRLCPTVFKGYIKCTHMFIEPFRIMCTILNNSFVHFKESTMKILCREVNVYYESRATTEPNLDLLELVSLEGKRYYHRLDAGEWVPMDLSLLDACD